MEKYEKVGGWLKFFCVVLTILNPLRGAFELIAGSQGVSQIWDQFPRLKMLLLVDGALSAGVMAFSIYAGISLWKVRPRAVVTAKYFLLSYLGYALTSGFLPFLAGFPAHLHGRLIEEILFREFQALIFFTVWLLYLSRSKRVRDTYPVTALGGHLMVPAPEIPIPGTESLPGATV